MPKPEFQETICLPFCDFYKPGTKEEHLCRGAWLVDRLVRRQRLCPEDFRGLSRDEPFPPGQETDLEAVVCESCPFRIEDCDFQSLQPPEDSRPCGGLLLLKQLLAQGKISPGDLTDAKN